VRFRAAVLLAVAWMPRPGAAQSVVVILIPSAAHAAGANGAFYTTDLSVANTGTTNASFTLKFLGHDQDGTSGPEPTFDIAAGATTTFTDVLGTVFSQTAAYGAIRIASSSQSLVATAQTSTPGFGGTFGQSVPGFGYHSRLETEFLQPGDFRSIVAVREDGAFRTNLILANATEASVDVDASLVGADGTTLGSKRYTLPPLGMTQVSRVVRDFGVLSNVSGARIDLTTLTPSAFVAAYASTIDNTTNDPRTLLPIRGDAYDPFGHGWWIPSAAHAAGANGAFYTTDLTASNTGTVSLSFTLRFEGHDKSGVGAPQVTFNLAPVRTVTYTDVLGTVFGQTSAYGAIEVFSPYVAAASGTAPLVFLAQTSTPGFGGTFGQSVAANNSSDLISTFPHSVLGVREDARFRTNLILCNDIGDAVPAIVSLVAADGTVLGSKTYNLPPLGMTQITRIVRDLGVSGDVVGARLVLSTSNREAVFVAYASVIDNGTNDPRTLLPLWSYDEY
jgi:hypothetical protein